MTTRNTTASPHQPHERHSLRCACTFTHAPAQSGQSDDHHHTVQARSLVLLVIIGAAGAYIASMRITSILGAVAWAFDFAMSGLFFPLVLGVWWKRANRAGAIAGMVLGLGAGTAYLIYVGPAFMAQTPWLGIDHLRFGIIGAPVSLIAMVVVSLMTDAPDKATQAMVDEVRIPSGKTILSGGK